MWELFCWFQRECLPIQCLPTITSNKMKTRFPVSSRQAPLIIVSYSVLESGYQPPALYVVDELMPTVGAVDSKLWQCVASAVEFLDANLAA